MIDLEGGAFILYLPEKYLMWSSMYLKNAVLEWIHQQNIWQISYKLEFNNIKVCIIIFAIQLPNSKIKVR